MTLLASQSDLSSPGRLSDNNRIGGIEEDDEELEISINYYE